MVYVTQIVVNDNKLVENLAWIYTTRVSQIRDFGILSGGAYKFVCASPQWGPGYVVSQLIDIYIYIYIYIITKVQVN